MQASKRHFEQVSVETVKRMVESKDLQEPANNDWQSLARAAASEPDSAKLINMVEEMLDKFDEGQRKKRTSSRRDS